MILCQVDEDALPDPKALSTCKHTMPHNCLSPMVPEADSPSVKSASKAKKSSTVVRPKTKILQCPCCLLVHLRGASHCPYTVLNRSPSNLKKESRLPRQLSRQNNQVVVRLIRISKGPGSSRASGLHQPGFCPWIPVGVLRPLGEDTGCQGALRLSVLNRVKPRKTTGAPCFFLKLGRSSGESSLSLMDLLAIALLGNLDLCVPA